MYRFLALMSVALSVRAHCRLRAKSRAGREI